MRKRAISALMCLTTVAGTLAIPTGATAAGDGTNNVTLTLKKPDGSPLANASVGVYEEPLEPGATYQPVKLGQGTADENGQYTFSLSTSTPEPEINTLITAVNPSKTWMVNWNLVMPSTGGTSYTITANINIPTDAPELASLSTQELASASETSCTPVADPDGSDPLAAETEADPDTSNDTFDPGTVQSTLECIPGQATPSEFSTDADGTLSHNAESLRWVKIANHHNARGMRSTFGFLRGRDTTVHAAVKVGGKNWEAGGFVKELSSRTARRTKTITGEFHRIRYARYQFNRYQQCICGPDQQTFIRRWKPHHWTGGLRKSRTAVDLDPRLAGNWIKLGVNDTFSVTNQRNINYGAGVSLVGLALNAQTGYSSITDLSWKGIQAGCDKYLYGKNTDPATAREVQARSNC